MIGRNTITINPTGKLDRQKGEIIRTLRANIEFTGVENRVIAITSTHPNDGKTTTSFYLAGAFADAGKKTLFVDADLRKSVFIGEYRIKNAEFGLSHLLSGQRSLDEVIYDTNIENLSVIVAGTFPTNPSELVGNPRFAAMLEKAREEFDYIIIDTPPIGVVIDAAVIAKQCDGSIFITASDSISRNVARSMVEQLRAANKNILGCVITKADIGRGKYYYSRSPYYGKRGSYYGYGYGGYGYGSYGTKQETKQDEKVGRR